MVEHVRHLRPMGVGDILDETIRLYRQNFRTFVAIAAAPLVPLIILQMIQAAIAGPPLPGQQMPGRDIFDYGSSIVLGILGLLCYVVIEAALTQAISERYLGHQPTVGGAYDVAAACLWRLLRASIRVALLLGLLTVTIVGIPFAIYFGVRWSLVIQAIVLDGTGPRQALARSSNLVQGRWWRVLGILVLATLMQLVAYIPAGIVGGVLLFGGALVGGGALYLATILNTAISGLFQILATPLLLLVATLLYYDLRVRKEGFDLQLLAEQLNNPA